MTDALKRLTFEDCKKSCIAIDSFKDLRDQCIFITGGTGFMGKWIAEMILFINHSQNYNIKLILLGRDIQRFKKEVPHLAESPFIELMEQDVRNLHDLPAHINYIIHAAGSPDMRDHVSKPLRTLETFYKGTQAVLDAATRLPNLKKLIHMSSHQVYGKNESDLLIKEQFSGTLELNNLYHLYAEAKRISETLCSIYKSNFRLPVVTLRPFAFVGPYQDLEKPWAINNFIRDGILGSSIRILGNGSTVRSYLYASDMAYWILQVLIGGVPGEIYNLGSNAAISLNDLAIKVKELINRNTEIISKSARETYTNVSKLVPDNAKITKALDVRETFSIEESLNRTIVWNQLNRK